MRQLAVYLSVLAAVIYAPLVLLLRCLAIGTPALAPIQLMAADAFYYLSVARHSIGQAFYTSDGVFPTNGFQPLWEWLLTSLLSVPAVNDSQELQLLLVFWLSLALVALGTGFFALVLHRLTENFALSLLAAVPGLYYLIFSIVSPHYNSTWSYVSGMESPLSILGFGLLCYLTINWKILLRPGYAATALVAGLITLLIFSRLDDLFLLIPYLLFASLFSASRRIALTRLLIMGGIPAIALLFYMLHNQAYAGSYLPVSGLAKQGFWLAANFYYFLLSFIPTAVISSDAYWSEGTVRTLQMVMPVLVALIVLAAWLRRFDRHNREAVRSEQHDQTVIAGLCLYVILKGAYNFGFVRLWAQGHWYFPLSIMIFNLVLARALGPRLKAASSGPRALGWAMAGGAAVLLIGNAFATNKLLDHYNAVFYNFWTQRSSIQRQLITLDPAVRIVEFDDGIISYALDVPTMSGFGYTLDQAAIQAKSRGQLLSLAHERGFHVIGVLYYYSLPPLQSEDDPEALRAIVRGLPNLGTEDLTRWTFSLLYSDPNSRALFIKFEPNP